MSGYDPRSGELTISSELSRDPIRLLVSSSTPVVGQEQGASSAAHYDPSDLVRGTLVAVKFESNKDGRGSASQIAILARPGSVFVFTGNVASLDTHSGLLVLVDPRDEKSYQISINSAALAVSQNLHPGDNVKVTTSFNGERYVATAVTVY